jgi:uncharacterized phage protein (TIGR02218 family)
MKQLSQALRDHLAQEVTTIATGWRVERRDGSVHGWVDHDMDVVIGGVMYLASAGLRPTSVKSTDDFSVDTLDVSLFLDVSTEHDLAAGIWDDAEVVVFEYNWSAPPGNLDSNVILLRVGHLGEVSRKNSVFTAEIRGLTQRLTTRIGRAYSPTCSWRHGRWDPSVQYYRSAVECGIDAGAYQRDGTVTALGANPALEFYDHSSGEGAGWYNEGLITCIGGSNHNVTREIRRWSNQIFELYRPFPFAITVGQYYRALAGDDKAVTTCKDKFNNINNFGGFPFLPGAAAVFTAPTLPG